MPATAPQTAIAPLAHVAATSAMLLKFVCNFGNGPR
jgi:hypothetical protein